MEDIQQNPEFSVFTFVDLKKEFRQCYEEGRRSHILQLLALYSRTSLCAGRRACTEPGSEWCRGGGRRGRTTHRELDGRSEARGKRSVGVRGRLLTLVASQRARP
ncbi:hypothetical protein E2C01_018140 [Portunus trituberculatus]|uniref:Uncharacterized protein n=1 Tax=Portunus trituberculatus TaxID=210409 RepID=A0A5B7DVL6_PORTR|nr:hypothetical protein [Portunus trituberculatus]